jgi:Cytochrome P460
VNRQNSAVNGLYGRGVRSNTTCMLPTAKTLLLLSLVLVTSSGCEKTTAHTFGSADTKVPELNFPEHYREWVYLTSGFDMSYSAGGGMADHHMFDNVFVNPEAYKAFLATGTWPDKTELVLEVRGAQDKGSINQQGHFQADVMGVEVHMKDEARFPEKWAFFAFGDSTDSIKMISTTADCYSCHAAHAAVDTTFAQFYPTLLPIAKSKGTLSAAYLKETETSAQKEPHH